MMETRAERLASFRAIVPLSAGPADLEEGKRLLAETSEADMETKVALLQQLGSFYLESQAIDPFEALEGATNSYQMIGDIGDASQNIRWTAAALCGGANILARKYGLSRSHEDFNAAASVFEDLIVVCEKFQLTEEATSNRINYASLLVKATYGDRFSNNDKAITLLRQALIAVSPEALAGKFDPNRYARVLYNLGVALLKQVEDPHVQNLYYNEAVDRFYQALNYRTAENDPSGRAKILRALAAVLPEWQGADSLAHAELLAEEALAEAHALEAGRSFHKAAWAELRQKPSALYWNMDLIAQNRGDMLTAINDHIKSIENIPKEAFPYLWAEWMGGYARLVGRIGNEDSNKALLEEARGAFMAAVETVPEDHDAKLCLALYREFGRMCHERGAWEDSLYANGKAAEIGLQLAGMAGTNVSRTAELESFTRSIHFAAYAACKLCLPEKAVEFAEIGRARWLDDAIRIASIRKSTLQGDFRLTVDQAQAHLLELERREHNLQDLGIGGVGRRLENYLGITFGGAMKIRQTADPNNTEAQVRNELVEVRKELQKAHENLGMLLNSVSDEKVIPSRPSGGQVKAIAEKMGFPIIYLLSTAWGTALVIVGNKVEILLIDNLTRNLVQELLYGDKGYVRLCGDAATGELESSLAAIQQLLDKHLMPPLMEWSQNNGVNGVAIVGLGDIGLLPIQVATVPAGLNARLLPSARLLTLSQPQGTSAKLSDIKLLTMGGVLSKGLPALDFSRVESLFFAGAFQKAGAGVIDMSNDATLNNMEAEIVRSTHLHFSTHGSFAPFSPFNSVIHLQGEEVLPVEMLLRPALKLAGVQLVILSACNSASSEYWRTPDETIGFPAAFLVAGAKTVIAAQWPVSDAATFLLMQQFCTELLNNNFNAALSLANAQRWLRSVSMEEIQNVLIEVRDRLGTESLASKRLLRDLGDEIVSLGSNKPFVDRFYWAAFVCVGA